MKKRFNFGKIDYYGRGSRRNAVTVDIEYSEKNDGKKEFTASAMIWNSTRSDCVCGGQCLDTIAKYIKHPVFKEIYRLWKLYHIREITVEAENIQKALEQYREAVHDKYYIDISKNALKTKAAMYRDNTNEEPQQCGYVITAKTDFDNDRRGWVTQYIDLWVTVAVVVNPFEGVTV